MAGPSARRQQRPSNINPDCGVKRHPSKNFTKMEELEELRLVYRAAERDIGRFEAENKNLADRLARLEAENRALLTRRSEPEALLTPREPQLFDRAFSTSVLRASPATQPADRIETREGSLAERFADAQSKLAFPPSTISNNADASPRPESGDAVANDSFDVEMLRAQMEVMTRESERYKEEAEKFKEEAEKFKAELAAREQTVTPGGEPAERAEATADGATAETHVFRRIRGAPDDVKIELSARTCTFSSGFSTIAAADKLSTEGIAYYEVEVLEAGQAPQFGARPRMADSRG